MIALLFRTVLVMHIELLLWSYCPKDFCPGLQTLSKTAFLICTPLVIHLVCTPKFFLISPECYSRPKRMYRMFVGQTRCITGDVQRANGTQSRL